MIGAEVTKPGPRILQQVPADHKDGTSVSDNGSLLTPPSGEPSIAFAREGVRPAGRSSDRPSYPRRTPAIAQAIGDDPVWAFSRQPSAVITLNFLPIDSELWSG